MDETQENNEKIQVDQWEVEDYRSCRSGKSHDMVWALLLIFTGIIFLLNNTGVIPWSIWGELWRFWPVLLILGGVKLIIGRGWMADVVVGLVAAVLFATIIVYALRAIGSPLVGQFGLDKLPLPIIHSY